MEFVFKFCFVLAQSLNDRGTSITYFHVQLLSIKYIGLVPRHK